MVLCRFVLVLVDLIVTLVLIVLVTLLIGWYFLGRLWWGALVVEYGFELLFRVVA